LNIELVKGYLVHVSFFCSFSPTKTMVEKVFLRLESFCWGL